MPIFVVFSLARRGIEPRSTVSAADALYSLAVEQTKHHVMKFGIDSFPA